MRSLQDALPHLQRLTRLLAEAPGGPRAAQQLEQALSDYSSTVPLAKSRGRQPTEAEGRRFAR